MHSKNMSPARNTDDFFDDSELTDLKPGDLVACKKSGRTFLWKDSVGQDVTAPPPELLDNDIPYSKAMLVLSVQAHCVLVLCGNMMGYVSTMRLIRAF